MNSPQQQHHLEAVDGTESDEVHPYRRHDADNSGGNDVNHMVVDNNVDHSYHTSLESFWEKELQQQSELAEHLVQKSKSLANDDGGGSGQIRKMFVPKPPRKASPIVELLFILAWIIVVVIFAIEAKKTIPQSSTITTNVGNIVFCLCITYYLIANDILNKNSILEVLRRLATPKIALLVLFGILKKNIAVCFVIGYYLFAKDGLNMIGFGGKGSDDDSNRNGNEQHQDAILEMTQQTPEQQQHQQEEERREQQRQQVNHQSRPLSGSYHSVELSASCPPLAKDIIQEQCLDQMKIQVKQLYESIETLQKYQLTLLDDGGEDNHRVVDGKLSSPFDSNKKCHMTQDDVDMSSSPLLLWRRVKQLHQQIQLSIQELEDRNYHFQSEERKGE